MTALDAVALAWRNLRQSTLRTLLTILGVAIGIASLTGMVSLGVGLQDQFVGRFLRSGVFDSITVTPATAQAAGAFGPLGRGGRGRAQGAAGGDTPRKLLDDAALVELAALDHVSEVYPLVQVPVQVTLGEVVEFAFASGVPMSARGQGAFQTIAHGEFLGGDGDSTCLLSLDMAARLVDSNPAALIGRELTLGYASADADEAALSLEPGFEDFPSIQVRRMEARFRVAGIVERETRPPGLGGSLVTGVMIPLSQARELHRHVTAAQRALLRARAPGQSPFQSVTVRIDQARHTADVQARIKALGYSAYSLHDVLQDARRAFLILDIILGLIGSVALAVASLGIINTMVMSILERTREIGIMKAIGGSDGDIKRIFLVEASLIGLAGGVLGLLLGWLGGRAINFGANEYIVSQGGTAGDLFLLPPWLVAAAIAFSVCVSLAAGLFPARRAARLDPVHALKAD